MRTQVANEHGMLFEVDKHNMIFKMETNQVPSSKRNILALACYIMYKLWQRMGRLSMCTNLLKTW